MCVLHYVHIYCVSIDFTFCYLFHPKNIKELTNCMERCINKIRFFFVCFAMFNAFCGSHPMYVYSVNLGHLIA